MFWKSFSCRFFSFSPFLQSHTLVTLHFPNKINSPHLNPWFSLRDLDRNNSESSLKCLSPFGAGKNKLMHGKWCNSIHPESIHQQSQPQPCLETDPSPFPLSIPLPLSFSLLPLSTPALVDVVFGCFPLLGCFFVRLPECETFIVCICVCIYVYKDMYIIFINAFAM